MGLKSSLWFNSIIALVMPVIGGKIIEVLTSGSEETLSSFFKMLKNNDIMVVSGLVFVISYFVALLSNWDSGKTKCPDNKRLNSGALLTNSIKVSVIVWIGFLMGVLIPVFQDPWINLFTNFIDKSPELVSMLPFISGGFVAMCLSWFATALSHFGYIQIQCAVTNQSVEDEIKKKSGVKETKD